MTRNKLILGCIAASAVFAGGLLIGRSQVAPSAPPKLTFGANYPNLQTAQRGIIQAWNAATLVEREYPNNAKVIADINTAGISLNQANDALLQAARDEDGR
jgi:polyisoprenoid-binding protein YceI